MKKYLNYHGSGVRNATVIYVKVAENVFAVSVSKGAKNERKNKSNRKNAAAGRKNFFAPPDVFCPIFPHTL